MPTFLPSYSQHTQQGGLAHRGHWCYSASFRRCNVCCGHYFISQNAFFCFLPFCLNISIGCNCCSDGEENWCGNPSGSLTKFPGVTSRTPSSFHLNIFSKEKTCHNFIQDRLKASSWSSLVCSCSLKVLQLHPCGFDAWVGPIVALKNLFDADWCTFMHVCVIKIQINM